MKSILLPLVLLFIAIGCTTTLKIDTDADNTYRLSSYKSFTVETPDLKEHPSQISINPILLQRVFRSIEQNLINRGLQKSSEPDMVVRFFIATQREVERSRSYGSWYRRGYLDDLDQRFYRVDNDALTIRFHDAKTDDVIWYAFSRFKRSQSPKAQEEVDSLIDEAISRFNSFP
ncbi:MAG: DUF4136 domain-containing protein [SAR86 cluster bacterium]|jgi:hypothetical protein|nr:DUF4136 domain-containing protein [SAR86 cluster bacterium]